MRTYPVENVLRRSQQQLTQIKPTSARTDFSFFNIPSTTANVTIYMWAQSLWNTFQSEEVFLFRLVNVHFWLRKGYFVTVFSLMARKPLSQASL